MIPNMLHPQSTEPTARWWISPDNKAIREDAMSGLASSFARLIPSAVESLMMKRTHVFHLAISACAAATMTCLATPASAVGSPSCDDAHCVPYVAHNVTAGTGCTFRSAYVFGLDPAGNTVVCTSVNTWFASPPLIGVRLLTSLCDGTAAAAQTPDGMPLACNARRWTDNSADLYARQGIPTFTPILR